MPDVPEGKPADDDIYDDDPDYDAGSEEYHWDPEGEDNSFSEPSIEDIIMSIFDQDTDAKVTKHEFRQYLNQTINADLKELKRVVKTERNHLKAWKKAIKKLFKVLCGDKDHFTKDDVITHLDDV